ncbi:cache domain-containing protein [Paenibacillus alba]|uniref:Cache domain-containing protein n=1 Tax=Paenibacillus alba TaxID=1197127 RepID=A0ABU6FXD5_9BACL|nr:cache domain-containing protein [Paenibacillus alba]MEC0226566.1 cache domain-containing protein [Paenibacillus alba]
MRSDSFRFKLMMLYFWTIVIPTVIIVFFLPNFFQKLLLHQTTQYTESTAAAFTKNIESYLNELERLTLTPYFDSDIMKALKYKAKQDPIAQLSPLEKLKMDEVLNEKFHNFIRMSRKDISGTTLVTSDGSIYAKSTGLTAPVNNYPFSATEWYRKALAAEGSAVFIGSHKQDYLKQPLETDVFSVARIIRDPDTELKLAFIIADADTGVLRNLIQDFQFNVNATIAVLDDNQQVVYSTAPLSTLMSKSVGESSVSLVEDENTYTVIRRDIGTAHWKLVFFCQIQKLSLS